MQWMKYHLALTSQVKLYNFNHHLYYINLFFFHSFLTFLTWLVFLYPWSLLPDNRRPFAWGEAYRLADEFTADKPFGNAPDSAHPPAFFIHNEDDTTAPVQGSFIYHAKLLDVGAPKSSLHVTPAGGHGFSMCQGFGQFESVCDWPKFLQRWLQLHGYSAGVPKDHSPGPLLSDMMTQNCD